MINLKKNEDELAQAVLSKVNLSKSDDKIKEHVVNLSKCVVNLSKEANVDLGEVKAQVVVVVDYSGSMSQMYKDGTVQRVINRLLPLGLTFDDNGEVEVFRFADGKNYAQFESLTIENYDDYVKRFIDTGWMGGTDYAPVLKEIKKQYIDGNTKKAGLFGKLFGKKENTSTLTGADASVNPVFVIFITDGDNSDKKDTNVIIRELSKTNSFIQFIGVGTASMSYLEKLDDLDGRECDNTGFERFEDIESVDDYTLYNKVLMQFADWLKIKGF